MMAAYSGPMPTGLEGMLGTVAQHDVSMSRLIDAPRAEVFRTWTDPVRLARWLGPYGLTDPVCEMELHPGGSYRIVMQALDGIHYAVSFEDEGGKTRVTLETPFASVELRDALLNMAP